MNSIHLTAGLLMFITGLLLISPVGLILLLVLFYAMAAQNLALGIISGLLLSTPMLFGLIWAPTAWAILIKEKCFPGLIKETS